MNAHEGQFSVQVICHAFGVSRSAYYEWVRAGCITHQERADAVLSEKYAPFLNRVGRPTAVRACTRN